MICKYCELIHSTNESYPLREATRDLNSDFPRCAWHRRYACDIVVGRGTLIESRGVKKAEKFICTECGKDHRQLNDDERIPWFLIIGALKQDKKEYYKT